MGERPDLTRSAIWIFSSCLTPLMTALLVVQLIIAQLAMQLMRVLSVMQLMIALLAV